MLYTDNRILWLIQCVPRSSLHGHCRQTSGSALLCCHRHRCIASVLTRSHFQASPPRSIIRRRISALGGARRRGVSSPSPALEAGGVPFRVDLTSSLLPRPPRFSVAFDSSSSLLIHVLLSLLSRFLTGRRIHRGSRRRLCVSSSSLLSLLL